ncbi:unnamed protein product [Spirodela intermedia]|uniref:Homeobox-leucine zipper protein n=1 Tax=Spirodela intermedia TaxID=51605 RepID=A0A7I8JB38_SPIIN|nr:unnamed protein product [Spirodela intermedia]CAA6667426.1 unnamed protein product [Spirodela intermedia]
MPLSFFPNGDEQKNEEAEEEGEGGGGGEEEAVERGAGEVPGDELRRERKLESGRKARLAAELGLDPKQVAVWFQNRRARWKSKQIEEEYVRLQYMHDAVLVDKSQLEAEVVKLKEQLSEAEKEIAKLSASCSERCSGSPSRPPPWKPTSPPRGARRRCRPLGSGGCGGGGRGPRLVHARRLRQLC